MSVCCEYISENASSLSLFPAANTVRKYGCVTSLFFAVKSTTDKIALQQTVDSSE